MLTQSKSTNVNKKENQAKIVLNRIYLFEMLHLPVLIVTLFLIMNSSLTASISHFAFSLLPPFSLFFLLFVAQFSISIVAFDGFIHSLYQQMFISQLTKFNWATGNWTMWPYRRKLQVLLHNWRTNEKYNSKFNLLFESLKLKWNQMN